MRKQRAAMVSPPESAGALSPHQPTANHASEDHAHEDAYVTVRDVFQALKRQLRERVRERREESRHPDTAPHGIVSQLFPEKGYGFIRADDGREIYFHRNAVLTGFDTLCVGAEAHFDEEEGENGPQASSIRAYGIGARPQ